MTTQHLRLALMPALLLIAACGRGVEADSADGLSASEAQALNDAAEMLDANAIEIDPADDADVPVR